MLNPPPLVRKNMNHRTFHGMIPTCDCMEILCNMYTIRIKTLKLCTRPIYSDSGVHDYTRSFNYRSWCSVYSFTVKTPLVQDNSFTLRFQHDFGLKSPIHVHKFEFFVEFVHTVGGFSGVSGECIFTHPAACRSAK